MELDEETCAEKEAENLQELSATNPQSSSVSSVEELRQVSGLCKAYKNIMLSKNYLIRTVNFRSR